MNKVTIIAAMSFAAISIVAAPIAIDKDNLLKKFSPIHQAAATEISEDEIICDNGTADNKPNGVLSEVKFSQPVSKPLYFSAESKCEGLTSKPNHNYAIYVDAQYNDNSMEYGIMAKWATGTHDWQKAEVVFVPKKPVARLSYYLLFRSQPGFASFRNATCRFAKESEIKK